METLLGDGAIGPTPSEMAGRVDFRLSCVAASDLGAGHQIAAADVEFRRPGTGLPPAAVDRLIGRRLVRGLAAGSVFTADLVESSTGPAQRVRVPHSRPFVGEEEAEAAAAVVRSRALAAGAIATEVEAEWCARTGASAAACVASGVGALRLGLWSLGVGAGDEVIVPAYSCVALLNAALVLGATPVLADVLADDWTLDPADAAARATERTRAAIAVDLFGMPARIGELRAALGVPVVEDCAHGIGGRTDAGPFGGGGDVAIGSFYATKMIAGGEGGILAARDAGLVERARAARDYGDQAPGAHKLNDKLTDVEAAIVREQLRKLDDMLSRRAERAARYGALLAPLADAVVLPPDGPGRIWYRYAVRLTRASSTDVVQRMAATGVRVEQPVWDLRAATEQWTAGLDRTAQAFDRVVSLPLYPDLTADEQAYVAERFAEVVGA